MHRRTLLSLSGAAVAGAAGCLSTSPDGRTTPADRSPSGPSSPTTAPPTTSSADVSVELDALQPVVLYLATDAIYVDGGVGQCLFLSVESAGNRPPRKEDFAFSFDGGTFHPFDGRADEVYRAYGDDGYDADAGRGWLLFRLPETGSAAEARLSWPGGEWRPDPGLRRRLEAPDPSFSLSTSFPETVRAGEAPTVPLAITNGGDLPGRFVAGLNRSGPQIAYRPVERISTLVPAGETVTYEATDDALDPMHASNVGDGEPDLTYQLDWAGGEVRRDVRLVE